MHMKKITSCLSVLGLCLTVTACDVSVPSQLETRKIQIKEKLQTIVVHKTQLTGGRISVIARDYHKAGQGTMHLLVPYAEKVSGAQKEADKELSKYRNAFDKLKVRDLETETVAMMDMTHVNDVIISYQRLSASAPAGCGRLPGHDGAVKKEMVHEYTIGCETNAQISNMIAHPSDLIGHRGTEKAGAQRLGTVIQPYEAGTRNEPLESIQASDIGG